jgi:hypothetical protein
MANVYGNNGNRWWVGLNVGTSGVELGSSGSIGGLAPNGYESLPSGNAKDDVQFTAAAAKDSGLSGKATPTTISVENILWFNINGPYTTQAAANAAIPAIQKAHPAPGEIQQITAGGQASAAQGGGVNPTSWETDLENFFTALSSPNLYIRGAKILAGIVLIVVGVSSMTGAGPVIVKSAVKSIPLL